MIWFKLPHKLMEEIEYLGHAVGRSHGMFALIPELKTWLEEHAPDYRFGKVATMHVVGVEEESTAVLLKLTWNLK